MVRTLIVMLLVMPTWALAAVFVCSESNDVYTAVGGARAASAGDAVNRAKENESVLVLADGYPDARTSLGEKFWQTARAKSLRLYVEYPSDVPGITLGEPRTAAWERQVATADVFGPMLRRMSVLHAHACRFLPVKTDLPVLMTAARVAGYDHADYGLPVDHSPILIEANGGRWLIATTKLSSFKSARYAPARDWVTVWQRILTNLGVEADPEKLAENPVVRPAFSEREPLPADAELQAFSAFANWVMESDLLLTKDRHATVTQQLLEGKELIDRAPGRGDGSYGILEGYTSLIDARGHQQQRLPLRADCTAESAMALALDYELNKKADSRRVATNLLNFVYVNSGMCKGERGNPKSAAYGLIAWGDVAPAWLVGNYGDDNARTLLATILSGASMGDRQWNDAVTRGIKANFRTTGKLGFRGDRVDMPALAEHGWEHFHNAPTVNLAPHFEAYLWACYLWAHARGEGGPEYLARTKTALRMTMEGYPDKWRWGDNIERSRMLLPLAWLVRVEDTPEHRGWLSRIAGDLLAAQVECGAIRERLRGTGAGHYQVPQSNEAYGTGETPLIQSNDDPASDQLYTNGFALLALHEAAAATGDAKLKEAEDKLAGYLCRIQTRAAASHPYLNGTWFRAFDFRRWDYYASSADLGWGAWSLEAGWAQAWTAATLALRAKGTTLWEFTLLKGRDVAAP